MLPPPTLPLRPRRPLYPQRYLAIELCTGLRYAYHDDHLLSVEMMNGAAEPGPRWRHEVVVEEGGACRMPSPYIELAMARLYRNRKPPR